LKWKQGLYHKLNTVVSLHKMCKTGWWKKSCSWFRAKNIDHRWTSYKYM